MERRGCKRKVSNFDSRRVKSRVWACSASATPACHAASKEEILTDGTGLAAGMTGCPAADSLEHGQSGGFELRDSVLAGSLALLMLGAQAQTQQAGKDTVAQQAIPDAPTPQREHPRPRTAGARRARRGQRSRRLRLPPRLPRRRVAPRQRRPIRPRRWSRKREKAKRRS
jgi:hypothetical protein